MNKKQQRMMTMRMDHEVVDEEEKISSECSSGCQSGWTMYLDHSSAPPTPPTSMHRQRRRQIENDDEEEEEEEEDLSMVSDASSGPPHFAEEEHCRCENGCCLCSASSLHPAAALAEKGGGGAKKRRVEARRQSSEQQAHSSLLDDTDSSPFFSFSVASCNATTNTQKLFAEDVLELSCGFSATHFKGKSAMRKHLSYFNSCAPLKPTPVSREEGEKKLW